MRFDPDRCCECGRLRLGVPASRHGLDEKGRIERDDPFGFCSDACFEKAFPSLEPLPPDQIYNREPPFDVPGWLDLNYQETLEYKAKLPGYRAQYSNHVRQVKEARKAWTDPYRRHWFAETEARKRAEQAEEQRKEQERLNREAQQERQRIEALKRR
jgi:hypothetical protein